VALNGTFIQGLRINFDAAPNRRRHNCYMASLIDSLRAFPSHGTMATTVIGSHDDTKSSTEFSTASFRVAGRDYDIPAGTR